MTPEQEAALIAFARHNGRYWKQKLSDAWYEACANVREEWQSYLQQLRNDPSFGPRGLARYRLPLR